MLEPRSPEEMKYSIWQTHGVLCLRSHASIGFISEKGCLTSCFCCELLSVLKVTQPDWMVVLRSGGWTHGMQRSHFEHVSWCDALLLLTKTKRTVVVNHVYPQTKTEVLLSSTQKVKSPREERIGSVDDCNKHNPFPRAFCEAMLLALPVGSTV